MTLVIFKLQNQPLRLGPNEFACPFCSKIMKLKSDMRRHIRTHTGEKPFNCIYCNQYFSRKSTLDTHVFTFHNNKNQWYGKNFNLQNQPIKLGRFEFACPFCNKIMKTNADMLRHIRTHTGEKPFACNYCNQSFTRKFTLDMHNMKCNKNQWWCVILNYKMIQ